MNTDFSAWWFKDKEDEWRMHAVKPELSEK